MIYLDHSATTPMSDSVIKAMEPYYQIQFGNASSLYSIGKDAREAIEKSREIVAHSIGATPEEIYFTSGGTEADNWVIKTCCSPSKNHIITTSIEHAAILNSCKYMESQGCKVTYLPVDNQGRIKPQDVAQAITPETALVSVMTVNNEIGTMEPIDEIARICHDKHVPFHTDAVQCIGNIKFDVHKQKISYLTLSGHKIYGPKGIGALYMAKDKPLPPFIHGGGQEKGGRSGTENAAQIMGLATALSDITADITARKEKLLHLRKTFSNCISSLPVTIYNDVTYSVPHIIIITLDKVEAEAFLYLMDLNGVCISVGSACHSGSKHPSHVLLALGMSPEKARSTIRISFGAENTDEEMKKTAEVMKKCFGLMRQIKR